MATTMATTTTLITEITAIRATTHIHPEMARLALMAIMVV